MGSELDDVDLEGALVDRDASGLCHASPGQKQVAIGIEALDTVVVRVGHEDRAVGTDRHVLREQELPVRATQAAPLEFEGWRGLGERSGGDRASRIAIKGLWTQAGMDFPPGMTGWRT